MREQADMHEEAEVQVEAVPPQAVESPYPAKVIICGMGLVVVIGMLMFGLADRLAQGWKVGFDAPASLRHAATALIVGGVIAMVFEMVIHRQASAAMRQVLRSTFRPVVEELQQQTTKLNESIETADKAIQLSHVMAVAQDVGLVDIFRDRKELFANELETRLKEERDITAIRMIGVSLRDLFGGDGPLYEILGWLHNALETGDLELTLEAVIMRGNCEDADLRIEVEEGSEYAQQQRAQEMQNWRSMSRLWSDYERVVNSWKLHFTKVDLREFDHLPTAWVMLVESRIPANSAVYVEQYHYGRATMRPGENEYYSCLGGHVPVLKFGPGETFSIFSNHLDVMLQKSVALPRSQNETTP